MRICRTPLAIAAAVGALVLPAAASVAGSAPPAASQTMGSEHLQQHEMLQDHRFIRQTADQLLAALKAAELALEQSGSESLKSLAREQVAHYHGMLARLLDLSERAGVPLPQRPNALLLSKLRLLEEEQGSAFDSRYADDFGIDLPRAMLRHLRVQANLGEQSALVDFARQHVHQLENLLVLGQSVQHRPTADSIQPGPAVFAARDAREQLDRAILVVRRMKADPAVQDVLRNAEGLFILTGYTQAAVGVGVQQGRGVLVTRKGIGFSNPVFYRLSGISIGLQAGASSGALVLLLMTPDAVDSFRAEPAASPHAQAGVVLGHRAERRVGTLVPGQDVVAWGGTRGLYAGVSVGLRNIAFDRETNQAWYGPMADTDAMVLDGGVASPGRNVLAQVLGS